MPHDIRVVCDALNPIIRSAGKIGRGESPFGTGQAIAINSQCAFGSPRSGGDCRTIG
jgi:hypothetical protein